MTIGYFSVLYVVRLCMYKYLSRLTLYMYKIRCVHLSGKRTSIVGREKQEEKKEEFYGESGAEQKKKSKKAEVTAEGSEHTWLNTCPRGKSAW